jgi:hypothetical protein
MLQMQHFTSSFLYFIDQYAVKILLTVERCLCLGNPEINLHVSPYTIRYRAIQAVQILYIVWLFLTCYNLHTVPQKIKNVVCLNTTVASSE